MDSLEGIMKIADQELDSIVKNGKFRSREEIESAEKLVKMMEKITCIWDMDSGEDGYSGGRSYEGGRSYARGRGQRRNSMGRYSRDGGSYYGRGSYAQGGYSGDFAEDLRGMMDSAPDEQTRQSLQRMLDQMGR